MHRFYTKLGTIFSNGWYWVLDYGYIARQQIASLFDHTEPGDFKAPEQSPSLRTVILLPGIYEKWQIMKPIARVLSEHGYDVRIIEDLGYSAGSIDSMANIVSNYLESHHITDACIVAHSKGGLVGKSVLMQLDGAGTLRGMVTLNTPFKGSRYAYLMPFRSLRIFTPRSSVLTTLAANQLVNSRIVSIYGRFDPHVPGGSELVGARNICLATSGHFRTIADPQVQQALLDAIDKMYGVAQQAKK